MPDIIPQTVLNKSREDKFILIIDTPKVLKDQETNSVRAKNLLNRDKMQYSIIAVNVPPHNIPAIGVPFRGQTPHVTSQTRDEYAPVKVAFTIDNNYDNYYFIWRWMTILNNVRNSGMDPYFAEFKNINHEGLDAARDRMLSEIKKSSSLKPITYKEIKMIHNYMDYQTHISLIGLREYNEKIIKFTYYDAFPVSLGGFEFDYRRAEEIGCQFDFAFSQFDIELIDPI